MEPIGHAVKLFHLPGLVSFCTFEDLDPLQGKSVGLICIIKAKHQYFIMMAHMGMILKLSVFIILTLLQKDEQKDNKVIQLSDSLNLPRLQWTSRVS